MESVQTSILCSRAIYYAALGPSRKLPESVKLAVTNNHSSAKVGRACERLSGGGA
jgi:hypothetical protein